MNSLLPIRFAVFFVVLAGSSGMADDTDLDPRFRRPVALQMSDNGKLLYTANRNSGSVSVIDTLSQKVVEEIEIGGRLTDIAVVDDQKLLALDEQNHQLILVTGGSGDWQVATRLDVPRYPIRLLLNKTTKRCFVSSLWSRAVTAIDLSRVDHNPESLLAVANRVQLTFEPREMCIAVGGTRLIVAGAYTNTLAIFETGNLELVSIKRIPGQNIRSMAVSSDGERMFLTQQELNPIARSTRDDVHWGNMLSNQLISMRIEDLCDTETDLSKRRVVHFLGKPGSAAGDPGSINIGPNGELAVLLSGVNELALGQEGDENLFKRIPVGRRPMAIASANNGSLYIANMLSDSVSIVDASGQKPAGQISLGPQPEPNLAELGEMLFFNAKLSHDGWMSCHSCHGDGHSSDQLNDNNSDGSFAAPKRVLSLLGVADSGPWAWNGEVQSLEQQVRRSIVDTMQGSKPTDEQVAAIVAFLKTLPTPPSLVDAAAGDAGAVDAAAGAVDVEAGAVDVVAGGLGASDVTSEIERGRELFQSLSCQSCHAPPTYTTPQAYDVGLVDEVGNRTFNPPSLLGVGRRQAFFHDASVRSLKNVFLKSRHQLSRELSSEELESLLLFLQSI